MRSIDIKTAVRVALIYGIRGLARDDNKGILSLDESMQGARELRQWKKIPAVLQSVLTVQDMFTSICSEFRTTSDEYDALILEFFDKDFRNKV
jgi:hypothetical protein